MTHSLAESPWLAVRDALQSGKPVVSRSNYLPPPADGAVLENGAASEKPAKRKAVAAKKKLKGGTSRDPT